MEKIVLSAKIKECRIISGKLEFEELALSSDECSQFKQWEGELLQVTIVPVQAELPLSGEQQSSNSDAVSKEKEDKKNKKVKAA